MWSEVEWAIQYGKSLKEITRILDTKVPALARNKDFACDTLAEAIESKRMNIVSLLLG